MNILGIDPGSDQTAFLLFNTDDETILEKGILENEEFISFLSALNGYHNVAVETIQCYGMPVGKDIIDTCIMIGRIVQALGVTYCFLYPRPKIKASITGMTRAKDSDVRRALIARFGGTKKGEPLNGVSKDMWSALAVAVYHADEIHYTTLKQRRSL